MLLKEDKCLLVSFRLALGGHQGRANVSDSVELCSSHSEGRATDLGSAEV